MTLREVIDNLEYLIGGDCTDTAMDFTYEIETAIDALKKQIPYKPSTDGLKVGVGRCKCGAEFLDKATSYCGNCGQRLDWSGHK